MLTMMREGESKREKNAEKEETLVAKLRRGVLVGKKVGPSTPTAHLIIIPPQDNTSVVSARQLAATLWEFHHYTAAAANKNLPFAKMHRGPQSNKGPRPAPRHHYYEQKNPASKEKALELSQFLPDASCPSSPDHQPDSACSLSRHIAQSLMQHHRSIETSNRALQPVSPASYGSSLEVAPCNPAVTPSSSLEFRGKNGESNYNLKTSTQLLKVLNRIWSLEEQHASNIAFTKALKTELTHARIKIKQLLQDRQTDRLEVEDLMKQITEDKVVRKSKEHDRINAAIKSAREELEGERKLRKRSESLHRKLARDLSESKSTLSNALEELERERKARKLLENLCDEFAKEIKVYEAEVHALSKNMDKKGVNNDRLILHIAESWLDERMQIKLEKGESGARNHSIVESLGFDLENFLRSKPRETNKSDNYVLRKNRRNSLESVPHNDAVSAPQDMGDDEDSAGSDSNCFELKKPSNSDLQSHGDETVKPNNTANQELSSSEHEGTSMQVKFEEQMAWAMSSNKHKKPQEVEKDVAAGEINISRFGSHERKNSKVAGIQVANSNHVMENIIRNHLPKDNRNGEPSCSRNPASPVRLWMPKVMTPDLDGSDLSNKFGSGLKEHTLKAKLAEARTKGIRTRLKLFKGAS